MTTAEAAPTGAAQPRPVRTLRRRSAAGSSPEALVAALERAGRAYQERDGRPGVPARVLGDAARLRRAAPRRCTRPRGCPAEVGARILLKREDLNHTGAHKIRNVLGQALLTRRMGKTRLIAETGAGQHGVATATAAASSACSAWSTWARWTPVARRSTSPGCGCWAPTVVPVTNGSRTLKDAINEALRDWVTTVDKTHYLLGTAAGPHPFPAMVRDFARGHRRGGPAAVPGADRPAAGRGGRLRGRRLQRDRHLPRVPRRRERAAVRLRGRRRRAGDRPARRQHHRRLRRGAARRAHLRAAGRGRPDARVALDLRRAGLPGRRPRARLAARHRPGDYQPVTDAEAMDAFALLCRTEGIIPAIESAHALAGALRAAAARARPPRRRSW